MRGLLIPPTPAPLPPPQVPGTPGADESADESAVAPGPVPELLEQPGVRHDDRTQARRNFRDRNVGDRNFGHTSNLDHA